MSSVSVSRRSAMAVRATPSHALHQHRVTAGMEIREITDTTRLNELLDGVRRAILTDAFVGDRAPENLLCLTPEVLAGQHVTPLSSHGVSVAQVIQLALTLATATVAANISLVGITIKPATQYFRHLWSAVSAALTRAVTLVRRLLEG